MQKRSAVLTTIKIKQQPHNQGRQSVRQSGKSSKGKVSSKQSSNDEQHPNGRRQKTTIILGDSMVSKFHGSKMSDKVVNISEILL